VQYFGWITVDLFSYTSGGLTPRRTNTRIVAGNRTQSSQATEFDRVTGNPEWAPFGCAQGRL